MAKIGKSQPISDTNPLSIPNLDDETISSISSISSISPSLPSSLANAKPITQSAANLAAEKYAKELELPKIPGKNVTFNDLLQWLSLLTEKQWTQVSIYLYRVHPLIQREPKYIDVICESFDIDFIINKFGGGRYNFWVKDLSKDNVIFKADLTISITQHDPILDIKELVDHKDNKSYFDLLKAKGLMDNNNKPIDKSRENMTQQPIVQGMTAQEAIAMMKEIQGMNKNDAIALAKQKSDEGSISKVMGDMAIQLLNQNSPDKLASLLKSMIPQQHPQQNNDTGLTQLIGVMFTSMQQSSTQFLTMMQENQKMMVAMIQGMNQSKEKQRDPLDLVDRVLDLRDRLANSGPEKEQTTFDKVMEVATPLMQVIGNAIAMKSAGVPVPSTGMSGESMPTPGQQQLPASSMASSMGVSNGVGNVVPISKPNTNSNIYSNTSLDPYKNPDLTIGSNINSNSQSSTTISQPDPELIAVINQYGNHILNSLNHGMGGAEFAMMVLSMTNEETINRIISKGSDSILISMKAVPDFWNNLINIPDVDIMMSEWCNDLVHYKEIRAMEIGDDNENGKVN